MKWLLIIFGILSNVFASVLIKVAMMPLRKIPSLKDPWSLITNIPLWSGLFLYGMAFVLYAAALRFFPLHVAHPVLTSGAIAGVALSGDVQGDADAHDHSRNPPHHRGSGDDLGEPSVVKTWRQ